MTERNCFNSENRFDERGIMLLLGSKFLNSFERFPHHGYIVTNNEAQFRHDHDVGKRFPR